MTDTKTRGVTRTVAAPGATITYDVREAAESQKRPLMLIGSPMGAEGFTSLTRHFTDRTVITYDPRGSERSVKEDAASHVDPDIHADDLRRVIEAAGVGPVDLFASSGGAINALALVSKHPEQVSRLLAHEPPLAALVPDSESALAACKAVAGTYDSDGWGAGMAHFIAVTSHEGPFTSEFLEAPPPDPAMFGMPTHDDGNRTDPLLGQNMITCTHYEPDIAALKSASTEIRVAAGMKSGRQLASRGAHALAERLGYEILLFPGDHGGFLGGEYGQMGEPEAFGAKLRQVLGG
ncbi:MAG TPA: alpha/beta hydrolase [Acidimicrobiia bacterium]|nr:alpha/beta hydrolase [Acidimicrobiia bacterium]